jgi:NADPH:quinone reductase-like Zn-dependent oxidoreductase
MSEAQWDNLLKKQGFSGLDLVLKDTEQADLHEISVMISTMDETDSHANEITKPRNGYVIVESPHQMHQPLTILIKESLMRKGFESCTAVNYHNLPSSEVDLKDAVCISLIGMGETNLSEISDTEFLGIKDVLLSSTSLLWVAGDETKMPESAMATGLIRTVRWERDLDAPSLVLLNVEEPHPEPEELAEKMLDCILTPGRERNEDFLLRGGELWAPRVRESAKTTRYFNKKAGQSTPVSQRLGQNPRAKLTTKSPGLLNKLVFEVDHIWHEPFADTDVEVKINAAGVNSLDVMIAMGQVAKMNMGFEASGVVTCVGSSVKNLVVGDRVVTFATQKQTGCFQSFFKTNENAVVKIPPQLSLDEAASIPMVFITAIYGLNHVARLSVGETILIHAAGGGVGQAAIQIAQLAGAEVFATVSTTEKRDWLIKEYGLAEDHIFSSRDLSFVQGVMRMTKNRGADVILNSLASEALRRSWDCIAPFGRFIELGKKDILSNGKLSMDSFSNNVTYTALDVASFMQLKIKLATSVLKEACSLFEQDKLRTPRPLNIYPYAHVETAFRSLQAGQAMGKTILKPHEDDVVQVSWFPSLHESRLDPQELTEDDRFCQKQWLLCNLTPMFRTFFVVVWVGLAEVLLGGCNHEALGT